MSRGWDAKAVREVLIKRHQKAEKPAKYRNRKTTLDGVTFDSAKEAKRYTELKMLEKAGKIRGLEIQQPFSLNTWHPDHAYCPKVGDYIADFIYDEIRQVPTGTPELTNHVWYRVVEDVKGMKTPLYRWKKKHFEAQYGIQIRET